MTTKFYKHRTETVCNTCGQIISSIKEEHMGQTNSCDGFLEEFNTVNYCSEHNND